MGTQGLRMLRCVAPHTPHALPPGLQPPVPGCACAGVACGAAASGHYQWNDPKQVAQLLTCMMMSGPFLTGFTQVGWAVPWAVQP